MNLIDVRDALVEHLTTLDESIFVPAKVPVTVKTIPCLIVNIPDSVEPTKTGGPRGLVIATYTIQAILGPFNPTTQEVLLGLMSTEGELSVYAHLRANITLDGLISNMRVLGTQSKSYSIERNGQDSDAIGCDFTVEVYGS